MLIHSQMDGAEGSPANLLLNHVLIDTQYCSSIISAVGVF